jgi:ATP-binding cassette subfamily B protein
MRAIFKYLWQYRIRILLGLLSLLLVDGTQLISPQLIGAAVDELGRGDLSNVLRFALYIVGLAILIGLFRFFWRFFLLGASRRIRRDVRNDLYEHVLTLSPRFFNTMKTGDLMAHFTNDVDAIMMACGFGLLGMADFLFMVTFSLGAMIMINPTLTLYASLPLPILSLMVLGFGRMIHRRFQTVQEVFSVVMEKVREALSGIRVIKTFTQESGMGRDFERTNQGVVDVNMHLVRISGLFDPLIVFMSGLSGAIALGIGGYLVVRGTISLGQLVAFNIYLGMLSWPMMALGMTVNVMQRGAASMERIQKILAIEPEIHDNPDAIDLNGPGLIEFNDHSFAYDGGPPVLHEINLRIEPGQRLGIVGLTGAGKTTLISLLLRLYEAPVGTLLIDGHPIDQYKLKALRREISLVPQNAFAFSQSIRENIALGAPDASEEEIINVARWAGFYEEILAMPQGLDTIVGERGVSLAGGQRQRLAIARALLMDPTILILDQAFSAVDTGKEEEILRHLADARRGKTTVIIAHRLSTIQDCDWIIVLDHGRIVEQGTAEELLRTDGLYARLHRLQQLTARGVLEEVQ